jgi:hypothetical protein
MGYDGPAAGPLQRTVTAPLGQLAADRQQLLAGGQPARTETAPDEVCPQAGTGQDELLPQVGTADLAAELMPWVRKRVARSGAVGDAVGPAMDERLSTPARAPQAFITPDEESPIFQGSRSFVDLNLPGETVPLRIMLKPATIAELVELWYRTGGWPQVDLITEAARKLAVEQMPADLHPDPWTRSRSEESVALFHLLRDAAATLARRCAQPLVLAEMLARREARRRLCATISAVAFDLARLAPSSKYARYLSEDERACLTPQTLAAQFGDHPWQADTSSPEFKQLADMIKNLAQARSWAVNVRMQGVASVTAAVTASAQGIIELLRQGNDSPATQGALEVAARLVAQIQQIADGVSGKAQTTAPVRPLIAGSVIGETFTLARDASARATQLVMITEAALGAVFPLARRLDTPALNGTDLTALAQACADTAIEVVTAAATVEQELGERGTSLKHLTDDRPDTATGRDTDSYDAFTYPLAVYAALDDAGFGAGSLPWTAATEVIRARGLPQQYMEYWNDINIAGGLTALVAKKAGPAAAVISAAHSTVEAVQRTWWFNHSRTTWAAVLEPSLRLIEQEPGWSDLASSYGTAFVDFVFALIELAPLLVAA